MPIPTLHTPRLILRGPDADPLGLLECDFNQVAQYSPSTTRPPQPSGANDPVIAGGRYYCVKLAGDAGVPGVSNGTPGGPRAPQREKGLPPCAQNFLRSRISSDPGSITFHDGGSIVNHFNNSVTYGNDVYLAGDIFDRHDANAMIHKFHEIEHTSQNSRMGITALTHAFTYFAFWDGSLTAKGIHDASPLEKAADDFGQATYDAYVKAGLDKTCRF